MRTKDTDSFFKDSLHCIVSSGKSGSAGTDKQAKKFLPLSESDLTGSHLFPAPLRFPVQESGLWHYLICTFFPYKNPTLKAGCIIKCSALFFTGQELSDASRTVCVRVCVHVNKWACQKVKERVQQQQKERKKQTRVREA